MFGIKRFANKLIAAMNEAQQQLEGLAAGADQDREQQLAERWRTAAFTLSIIANVIKTVVVGEDE